MNKISQCNICGEFFNSKKDVKEHKNKDHRITNSRMVRCANSQSLPSTSTATIHKMDLA
jgi:hypothetical protein